MMTEVFSWNVKEKFPDLKLVSENCYFPYKFTLSGLSHLRKNCFQGRKTSWPIKCQVKDELCVYSTISGCNTVQSVVNLLKELVYVWPAVTTIIRESMGGTDPPVFSAHYRWISWCILPWELEGITSSCRLLIGQYPHHMTLCPPVAIVKRCFGSRLYWLHCCTGVSLHRDVKLPVTTHCKSKTSLIQFPTDSRVCARPACSHVTRTDKSLLIVTSSFACFTRFSCCSLIASASAAAPWLHPLQLLLPDCIRFSCCSPIASTSAAAPWSRPLQLLLPNCVHFSCCSPIEHTFTILLQLPCSGSVSMGGSKWHNYS